MHEQEVRDSSDELLVTETLEQFRVLESTSDIEKRKRTLSEKGHNMYEQSKQTFEYQLYELWNTVEDKMKIASTCDIKIEEVRASEQRLSSAMNNYRKLSDSYTNFLTQTRSQESLDELESHIRLVAQYERLVENELASLNEKFQTCLETGSYRSRRSGSSRRSRSSELSSVLARKKAEANAAQAGVAFIKGVADLQKQKALITEKELMYTAQNTRLKEELSAEIKVIQKEREAAEAAAEVKALQSVAEESDELHSELDRLNIPVENPKQRTVRYVDQHASLNLKPSAGDLKNCRNSGVYQPNDHDKKGTVNQNYSPLNPNVPTFVPRHHVPDIHLPPRLNQPVPNESSVPSDLVKFLLKKDMVLTRLSSFSDRPQQYRIWKAGFKSVMSELQVTPAEELDLLVKWLGVESSNYAINIRAASVNDPRQGLVRVWERLDERYGSPELIEAALKSKLSQFPKITHHDYKKLYDLADILSELEATKRDDTYAALLSYYDTSAGVNPIVSKLPYALQEKWTAQAINYKRSHNVAYPPFSFFVQFVQEISRIKNDPGFVFDTIPPPRQSPKTTPSQRPILSAKTDITEPKEATQHQKCPIHGTRHSLLECRGFRSMPIPERKSILAENNLCFRCCGSKHGARNCNTKVSCEICNSNKHPTALHVAEDGPYPTLDDGGESYNNQQETVSISSKCTQICNGSFNGKSCGKTVLVNVHPKNNPKQCKTLYAIIDDQSNQSLATSDFFDQFNIDSLPTSYLLSSCAGQIQTEGRRVGGYVVESIDGGCELDLPDLIECENIPNRREEIPTPEVARFHQHLNDIQHCIPPLNDKADIQLLIGRDLIEAHHVLDQRTGPHGSPYAQKLRLGWVIVGESCLGRVHKPTDVVVNKTHLSASGRTSIFSPCPNRIDVLKDIDVTHSRDLASSDIFKTTTDDNKPGLSVEDRKFLQIMADEVHMGENGNLVAPLPFRTLRPRLPCNRSQAHHRARSLHFSLQKNPEKCQQMVDFMQAVIDAGHAEVAPPLTDDEEHWYLPLFGVYHPKKPGQIRGVFDASSVFEGLSLNSVLLTGPDLTNNLLGVLMRFREGPVAVTADIEKMFYNFYVTEGHRNYLRFLWYEGNNPSNPLIDYRMCVHVFGNNSSPAVATYGLRQIAKNEQPIYGNDITDFICRDFYVDDGLVARNTSEEAIDIVSRTREALAKGGNLKLHKIASNSPAVMAAIPVEDHVRNMKNVDMCKDTIPMQRSLGLNWDLNTDCFTFQVSRDPKPFTRRGILSTVNSIYDPIGFVSPVTIKGKLLLRELMEDTRGWDEALSPDRESEWRMWRESLLELEHLRIPRNCYAGLKTDEKSVHIFCDASEQAISAVAYLKDESTDPHHTGFLLGKSKVAPSHGHTIPRLELCGAVLAIEIAEFVADQVCIPLSSMHFYTDSKVVLGYIYNETRRFYTYVSNRVHRIRSVTQPTQWSFVPTDVNPADDATRCKTTLQVATSAWFLGPSNLPASDGVKSSDFCLRDPEQDLEIRPVVKSTKTEVTKRGLDSQRFQRFSSWQRLIKAIERLQQLARSISKSPKDRDVPICAEGDVQGIKNAEAVVIRAVQQEAYGEDITCIRNKRPLSKKSPIANLSPALDDDGLLRVGGRLRAARIPFQEKRPLLIPGKSHIAKLLILHYHERVQHQGRHFTEGAVRSAGFWITGANRLISSELHHCLPCRKFRATHSIQKMADLPEDRLEPSPPFTHVGVDVFGPWNIVTRRTRGGQANSKRWAVLFTCLVSRAVHIEVIEEMSSSCFTNALRRFVSLRGPVTQFRSDRGTNFVGAVDDLRIDAINIEDGPMKTYLHNSGVTWVFNAPHSSHMGGVWERLIGVARRILDNMLAGTAPSRLTHEVLSTFMAEVCAIMNNRPLVPVSSDAENPFVLSPSILLHQKTGPPMDMKLDFDIRDLYKAEWRRVQALADMFWSRWRSEYIQTLQSRRKWQTAKPNIKSGDVILLKDVALHRNDWPMGVVIDTFPDDVGKVRKVSVRVAKDSGNCVRTRPISEIILLLEGQ